MTVPFLMVAGLFILVHGITGLYTPLTGWSAEYNTIGGLTILLTGYAAHRFHRQIVGEMNLSGLTGTKTPR